MFKRLIKQGARLTSSISADNNQIRSYFETAFPIHDSEGAAGGVILKFKNQEKWSMMYRLIVNVYKT